MDIKRNIVLTILFFCVLNINYCFSQIKAYNDKGEKILVYPDGSWEYDKEGEESEKAKKPKKAKAEEAAPAYTREEMRAVREEVTGRYRKARVGKQKALKEKRDVSYDLVSYVQAKEEEHLDMPMNGIEKSTYKSRLKIMKRKVKDAKKRLKVASKKEKKYQKLLTYTGDKLMDSYGKMVLEEGNGQDEGVASNGSKKGWNPLKKEPENPLEEAKRDYEKQLEEIKKKKEDEMEQQIETAKLRSDKLLGYLNNLKVEVAEGCELAFDEVDGFTGKRKRGTKTRRLFSFVDEGHEAVLKGKGYLVCEGFISEINKGKDYMAVLDYTVKSTTGKEEFGGFNKGAAILIMLIDGSKVILKNDQGDRGTVNAVRGTTVFRGYYSLPKAELKVLASKEITNIRVIWADGFEDYEIYEMDFFRNQINCLKERK